MSDYPMLISNKLHSFRNFQMQIYTKKQKNQQVGRFYFVKVPRLGIVRRSGVPATCILGFQQRIEEVQAA